jgi:hypothetical protein
MMMMMTMMANAKCVGEKYAARKTPHHAAYKQRHRERATERECRNDM